MVLSHFGIEWIFYIIKKYSLLKRLYPDFYLVHLSIMIQYATNLEDNFWRLAFLS